MATAGGNVQFVDAVVLGKNSVTVKLNTLLTLVCSRSTADPVRQNISFSGGVQVLNFVAGMIAILMSASMVKTVYLFVNTGSGQCPMSLDGGGTIGGVATYVLMPGQAIEFSFDGTNLT